MNFLLIPLFSLLNALRGGAYLSRPLCALGMGVGVATLKYLQAPLQQALIMGAIVFIDMWLGLVLGWGKYLNIFSGDMKYVNESEVKPIDWIATKICGFPTNSTHFVRWCFVAMTLRGVLFYPVFITLSWYNHNALCFGVGVTLMGAVYYVARIAPPNVQVRVGEVIYGALLGLLISFSV